MDHALIEDALAYLLSHKGSAVVTLVYGLSFINCLRVVQMRQSTAAVLAWLLLHIFAPFFALPLFYLFGQNRMRGFVKRRRKSDDKLHNETGLRQALHDHLEKEPVRLLNDETNTPVLRQMSQVFSRYGEAFWPSRNHLQLLVNGEKTFAAIFSAISNAKTYIFVQYYILRSDRLGIELKKALIAKSKSGVKVFLLYDDMGSFWLSRQYVRDLREAGVYIAKFLPVTRFSRLFLMNFRNHRKLVIVDGEIAFTGGLNVGEEYVGKKKGAHWRDTHIKIAGPAVKQLEEVFLDDWHFAADSSLASLAISCVEQNQKLANETTYSQPDPNSFQAIESQVQVIASGPTDQQLIGLYHFIQTITVARERLWISTPYFVPNESILRLIELACLRGVDVRLLLPNKRISNPVQWASVYFAEDLYRFGVQVYFYKPGFMHQKVTLVDDTLVTLGTSNMDNRTMYLNFETTLLCHGKKFAQEVAKMLEDDFSHSEKMEKDLMGGQRGRLRRSFARLLSPML